MDASSISTPGVLRQAPCAVKPVAPLYQSGARLATLCDAGEGGAGNIRVTGSRSAAQIRYNATIERPGMVERNTSPMGFNMKALQQMQNKLLKMQEDLQ